MNKQIEISEHLKSVNIYALYKDGEFSTTEKLRDGWIMLIDIGRHRHTIMTNPKTTPDAIEFCGQFWHKSNVPYDGKYIVIDDDWNVHQSTQVTEEDFNNVKYGIFAGILCMPNRCYMRKDGEFILMV